MSYIHSPVCEFAIQVLMAEAQAVQNLCNFVSGQFERAVQAIMLCQGKLVILGTGKSGYVGRKVAATFASTGTPAFFVSTSDAMHGELGVLTSTDLVILLSYSGETQEILVLVPIIKSVASDLIAITNVPTSTLARASDIVLTLGVSGEADPGGFVPTASSAAMMALGDALAVVVSQLRGFRYTDYARVHPAGKDNGSGQEPSTTMVTT